MTAAEACNAKACEVQSYVVGGKTLGLVGVRLNPELHECPDKQSVRVMFDFGSRLYSMDEIE